MRTEYVIVGFVLALVVLIVFISLLTGVVPSIDALFKLLNR